MELNEEVQLFLGIPLKLIKRHDYHVKKAKRFVLNGTNQNVWIPNKHLLDDGTIKNGEDILYVFIGAMRKFELSGIELRFAVTETKNARLQSDAK